MHSHVEKKYRAVRRLMNGCCKIGDVGFEEHRRSLKSEVWNYFLFEETTEEVKCKHCGYVLIARGCLNKETCQTL